MAITSIPRSATSRRFVTVRSYTNYMAVALCVIALSATGLSYGTWRSESGHVRHRLAELGAAVADNQEGVRAIRRRLEAVGRATQAELDLLQGARKDLRILLESRDRGSARPQSDEDVVVPADTPNDSPREESLDAAVVLAELGMSSRFDRIEPPGGLDSNSWAQKSIDAMALDERINPQQTRLDPAAAAELNLRIVRAQCRMRELAAEVQAELPAAIAKLRARGDYFEHDAGSAAPVPEAGVLTVAEAVDQGTVRTYYLYPEEFGHLQRKRDLRRAIGAAVVREMLGTLNPEAAITQEVEGGE